MEPETAPVCIAAREKAVRITRQLISTQERQSRQIVSGAKVAGLETGLIHDFAVVGNSCIGVSDDCPDASVLDTQDLR
jgi:hypothetical protein